MEKPAHVINGVEYNKFGEEIVKPSFYFETYITSRCNFGCPMCFQRLSPKGPDMELDEFKKIVDGVARVYKKRPKNSPSMMFVVAGGEAFLNPHAPEMLAYATQVFGRDAVSVTTNYSTFPEKTDEVVALLRRCGRPRLVLSIDRTHNVQHTKIQSNNLKKLQAILFATTKLGISVSAISTGVNAADVRRAKKFLLSKAILPYEFREDFLSPANIRRFRSDIRLLESGRVPIHQHPIEALGYDYAGDSKFPRVHIAFHNNGKAYFIAAPRLNLAPLAIGSWQREAMGDLLGPNLQLKSARILGWISGKRLEAKTVGGHSRLTSVSAKAQQEKFLRVVKRHLKREEDFRKGVRRLETNARKKQFGRIPLRVLH